MSTLYQYIPELNPEPWAVGVANAGRKGGKIRSGISPNQKLVTYQKALQEMIAPVAYPPHDHAPFDPGARLQIHFYFWRQLESYTLPSGADQLGHVADVTNLQKATEDALQGVLFHNDRDNVDVHSRIMEQDVDTVPGVFYHIEGDFDEPFDHDCPAQLAWDLYREWLETEYKKKDGLDNAW